MQIIATINLMAYAFEGSNPSAPITRKSPIDRGDCFCTVALPACRRDHGQVLIVNFTTWNLTSTKPVRECRLPRHSTATLSNGPTG